MVGLAGSNTSGWPWPCSRCFVLQRCPGGDLPSGSGTGDAVGEGGRCCSGGGGLSPQGHLSRGSRGLWRAGMCSLGASRARAVPSQLALPCPALPVPRSHTARCVSGSGCLLPQDALPLGSPFPRRAEGLRVSSLLF